MKFSFIYARKVCLSDNHGLVHSGVPNEQWQCRVGITGNSIFLTFFWCSFELFSSFFHQTFWKCWYTRHEIEWNVATLWGWRVVGPVYPHKLEWLFCFLSHSFVRKAKFVSWLLDVSDLWASDLCVALYDVPSTLAVLICCIDLRVCNIFHRCLVLMSVT
jgi:hypothetical protein